MSDQKCTILITGGSAFMGSNLAMRLLADSKSSDLATAVKLFITAGQKTPRPDNGARTFRRLNTTPDILPRDPRLTLVREH